MGTVTTLPHGRALTRADLESMPDDGHRYELVDGTLVVTPAPSYRHQDVVGNLYSALIARCPGHLKVLLAPFDIVLGDDTVLQPDLLVAPREAFTDRDLPGPPLLAVEVLSPSTRLVDQSLKRARFESAGSPSCWVVDPDTATVIAWELRDDEYVEVGRVSDTGTFRARQPFAVDITPGELLG